jgi:hypothetical protein
LLGSSIAFILEADGSTQPDPERLLRRKSAVIVMQATELVLICLVAVALLALLARKIRIPYPILLTVGGVGLAFVPELPAIQLEPELIFNLFLALVVRRALRFLAGFSVQPAILLMAIVLVLLTMTVTAGLFHYLVGLPWAVGFVFGAIISPPDAVAALAITQNLRVPRRIIVILEGESLVNDATSFISFRFAVAAVMTGVFSLGEASLRFLLVATGGIVVGLAVGWLATQLQKRLDDPPVQTMFSLLTPYVSYFAGETLHVRICGRDYWYLLRLARTAHPQWPNATWHCRFGKWSPSFSTDSFSCSLAWYPQVIHGLTPDRPPDGEAGPACPLLIVLVRFA